MVDHAMVSLWGQQVGYVVWQKEFGYAVFEYEPNFLRSGLDIAPIQMSIKDAQSGDGIFFFPELRNNTFFGLPGLLSDALPDKFGNRIIDAWLARNGRDPKSFNPVERLCYMGKRGMGALEFVPRIHPKKLNKFASVEIARLVELTQNIMEHRQSLDVNLGSVESENTEALTDILRVGTSAGGARPKAVIAINDKGHIISGQTTVPKGYDCWILKFDGVSDEELGESKGYGRIEYAYYLMAKAAKININECRLLEEGGRAHFMTKRFDRKQNEKIHMLSLCGLAHFDFNVAGGYSYEQAFGIMRALKDLNQSDMEQQFRRIVFNILARNQDDHTKNISFLMDKSGCWSLSPAYDITFSYNPGGVWTNQHQMSINGKRDGFVFDDLLQLGEAAQVGKPAEIIRETLDIVQQWPDFAKQAGLTDKLIQKISAAHRIEQIKNSLPNQDNIDWSPSL